MFKIRFSIVSLLIILSSYSLSAEGFITANYAYSKPTSSASLSNLTPNFCCYSNFTDMKTTSRGVSIGYIQRVSHWYLFGASVGYSSDNTAFSSYNNTAIGIDGKLMDAFILSRINANSDIYHISLDFAILEVYKNLFITGSFKYKTSGNTDYNQYEQLVEPVNQGVFQETQTRYRNQSDSTLNNAFQSYGLAISARYLIPVYEAFEGDNTLYLAPELEFAYSMSKFYKSDYWYSTALVLKLGLQFRL